MMNQHKINELYSQFSQQYHAKQFDMALHTIQQITQLKPDDAEAWSNAATIATHAGKPDLAIDYALKTLAIQPDYANARQILLLHYKAQFQRLHDEQNFPAVLEKLKQILALSPNDARLLSSAASTASRLKRFEESNAYALQSLAIDPDHINSHDVLSLNYYSLGNNELAAKHGLRALQLRDKQITPTFRLPETWSPRQGKQIISFSLFGASPKYLEGAILNAQVAPEIYPDWTCRFYVDNSVPAAKIQQLRDLGAEVIEVSGEAANWVGTVWRFLALDDETVARVMFRDVDSIISWREAAAVREWVESGKRFHTIRDGGSHTELILAGLWGAVGGAIDDITGKLRDYFSQPLISRHFADQYFLREKIWAYVKQDVFAHDRLFGFLNAHPLPELSDNQHHIGSCQMTSHLTVDCPFPEHTMMVWTVRSRIAPTRAADFTWRRLPEMRTVCEYESPVLQGKITLPVAKIYLEGLATNDTIISVSTQKIS